MGTTHGSCSTQGSQSLQRWPASHTWPRQVSFQSQQRAAVQSVRSCRDPCGKFRELNAEASWAGALPHLLELLALGARVCLKHAFLVDGMEQERGQSRQGCFMPSACSHDLCVCVASLASHVVGRTASSCLKSGVPAGGRALRSVGGGPSPGMESSGRFHGAAQGHGHQGCRASNASRGPSRGSARPPRHPGPFDPVRHLLRAAPSGRAHRLARGGDDAHSVVLVLSLSLARRLCPCASRPGALSSDVGPPLLFQVCLKIAHLPTT